MNQAICMFYEFFKSQINTTFSAHTKFIENIPHFAKS